MVGIQYILNLGIGVMLAIVIFILSLIFRVKISLAIRSSLLVGVALIAINMVVGFLMGNLGPVTSALVERTGLNLTIIDVGWPAAASVTWASPVAAFFIPVGIIINLVLLATQITKTVNLDLWNYWVMGFSGAMVSFITSNIIFGIIAFIITEVFILIIADRTAKKVQDFFNMPKVSIPHGNAAPFVLLAYPLQFIFERIPGFNKLKADSESIQLKFGVLGEPVVIGIIIGLGLSILAGFNLSQILTTSMSLAAAMVVFPRVTKILMEGLIPISDAASVFLQKRFPGKDFYIGLDTAITVGSSEVLATGLVLIPISLFLAFIIPGNKLMPVADIVGLPFIVSLTVPIFRGNVIRSIISGTIICIICLLIGTNLAPIFTNMAISSGVKLPEGAIQINSYLGGTSPITWVLVKLAALF